jgi:hypothetical protein
MNYLAGRGECRSFLRTIEERCVDFLLEATDGNADGGLRAANDVSRLGKATLFHNFQEEFKLRHLHLCLITSLDRRLID